MIQVKEIDLNKIKVGDRARKNMGDIEELTESIRQTGLIQPITVDDKMNLLAGHRRFIACQEAGLKKIPCVIRKSGDEVDAMEIELYENIHRKDFEWMERANLTRKIHAYLVDKHGENWSLSDSGKLLNRSKAFLSRAIQVSTAAETIPELANSKSLTKAYTRLQRIDEIAATQQALDEHNKSLKSNLIRWAADHYQVGDAIAGLEGVHAGVMHFAEVDPPYAIRLTDVKPEDHPGADTYEEIKEENYPDFVAKVATQVYRVLSEHAFCVWWFGPSWHGLVKGILNEVGFKVDEVPAIWYKVESGAISYNPNVYLARAYENFFVCRKGNPQLRKRGRSNVFEFRVVPSHDRIHSTERPIPLMKELLETFSYPKGRVIIPFLGSGNTLLACYLTGMTGVGWDLSGDHKKGFLMRVARMSEELEQEELSEATNV